MVQAYGQPGSAQGWARVQLVRGQSNGGVWQVDHTVPQARLSVGSDAGAGWPVNAFGVLPMHFELYWDGRSLYVADTQRVGGVSLNGAPLGGEWLPVRGRGEIVFGQAALTVETNGEAAPLETDPSVARRISVTPDLGTGEINAESTRIAEPMFDPPSLAGERTMIAEEMSLPSPAAPPRAGASQRPPPPPGAPSRPPPPPMARPRLGGGPPPPATMSATNPQVAAPPEATRMLSLDEMPPDDARKLAGSPGGFGAPSSGFGGQPSQGQGFGQPSQGFGQQGQGFGQPPPPSFGAPSFGQQVGPGSGYGGVTVAPPEPVAPGGFAPPPSFDQAASAPIRTAPKIPPRTLALGGVAVLALVGVLFLGGPAEEEAVVPPAPIPPPAPVMPPPVPGAPTAGAVPMPGAGGVPTPGMPPPGGAPTPGAPTPLPPGVTSGAGIAPLPATSGAGIAPLPPGGVPTPPPAGVAAPPPGGVPLPPPPGGVAPPTPAPPVATAPSEPTPATAPAVDPATLPPTDDRLAADLVIAGRYSEALPRYQALAAANPGRPEYAAMVDILTERLSALSCINGLTPDGRPCTVGGTP